MKSSFQLIDPVDLLASTDPELSNDRYLLSALLEHTTDSIYFKDLDSRFVKINEAHARRLHLSDPKDAVGKRDMDFFGAVHGWSALQDELEIIRSGQPMIVKEEREDWPDGSITWASTSKMPLFNTAGKCIGTFGVSRDITARKQAEKALSNSHRDAELFINSVPSILIGLDASGHIKRWNHAAVTIFGISKEEASGKTLASCGIKWLRTDIDAEIGSLAAQVEPLRWDLDFEKNGEKRLLGLTLRWIRPIESDTEELLIVGADVTERKRADEDLLWKTAFLEAQTNSTGDGILIIDPNGQRLLQNKQLPVLLRIPPEIAEKTDEASLREHGKTILKGPGRAFDEIQSLNDHRDQTSRDELELIDGTVLERYSAPVLGQSDKYYGRMWTFRDITERKRIGDALRQLSLAVEQSPASVIITDPEGMITYANRRFTEASGYTVEEVIGRSPAILKSGYSTAEDYRQMWQVIKAGGEWRGIFHNRKKNGELFWESAVIRPIEDHQGSISHFLALKEDITEKLAMEAQLRQSQKLEAIGQLAAGIAHEINTPIQYVSDNTSFLKDSWNQLAGLLTAAQKLRDQVATGSVPQEIVDNFDSCAKIADVEFLSQDIPRAIDQTLDGVQRVSRIVRAMKEFSHPGSQDKRAVDLNRAIETTMTISRNEWKYLAEVKTQLDPDLPLVPCLAGEINQVLLNLVVNASHAIADVARQDGDPLGVITISTQKDGEWALISVADTGTGIPEHVRERVFDPFFTTKDVGKGTGQGLMLAHTVVVKKHGGKIWFDSEIGKGTTFFVRLPISVPVEN